MKKQTLCALFVLLSGALSLKLVADQNSLNLSEKIIPSVVFIAVEETFFNDYDSNSIYSMYGYLNPFYEYFWPSKDNEYSEYAHGSGFIINEKGYIVTCAHVVENATHIRIVMKGAEFRMYEGKIIGVDKRSDLAVVQIVSESEAMFPFLELGDSNSAKVGDPVLAIGNPIHYENESTVTRGIISAKERTGLGMSDIEGYIQTDAAIHGGNSGGPLINVKGKVLGVNAIGSYSGLAWAVPSNTVKHISEQLIAKGKVSQGFFGIELDLTKEDAFNVFYFDSNNGARVIRVIEGSPAEQLGIEAEDIIEEVNGHLIESAEALRDQVCILEENTTIHLIVNRKGIRTLCSTKLGSSSLSEIHCVFPSLSDDEDEKLVI